jgi:hypothetical protein
VPARWPNPITPASSPAEFERLAVGDVGAEPCEAAPRRRHSQPLQSAFVVSDNLPKVVPISQGELRVIEANLSRFLSLLVELSPFGGDPEEGPDDFQG